MALSKAKLIWWTLVPPFGGVIDCQFNPASLEIDKSINWDGDKNPSWNAPFLRFTGGNSAEYSLSLFFDAYGEHPDGSGPKDVREYTNQLLKLTLRGAGNAIYKVPYASPPFVKFVWGSISLFTAIVTRVKITFTLFNSDGTPIRAKAVVNFKQNEILLSDDLIPAQNPTSRTDARKTRIAYNGQRLDQIAFEEYGDSRYWRRLADANGLDNPFQLKDGQLLVIPPVE